MNLEEFLDEWGPTADRLNIGTDFTELSAGDYEDDSDHTFGVMIEILQSRKERVQNVIVDGVTLESPVIRDWIRSSALALFARIERYPLFQPK